MPDNPFNPKMVYKMSSLRGDWVFPPGIALGFILDSVFPDGEIVLHAVRASAGIGGDGAGLVLQGRPVAIADGVIDFLDTQRTDNAGKEVVWRFEPLTLDVLASMRDGVQNYSQLVQKIATDEDLQQLYMMEWLPDGYEDFL
jgi:hypothetical protein